MENVRDILRTGLRYGLRELSPLDCLAVAWLIACGGALAERGTIVGYADEVVQVEVRDNTWLEQMRSMGDQLQAELARITGLKIIGIHFVVKR
jgi:hypothetical protein